jgi:cytochrome d ubiquinol oxidase subunit I
MAMLGLAVWGLWARLRRRLYEAPWLHRAAVAMGPAGFVAVLAG